MARGTSTTTARRANRAARGVAKNSSQKPRRLSIAAASDDGSAWDVERRAIGRGLAIFG